MPDPEALARIEIDRQLDLAGWIAQDRNEMKDAVGANMKQAESLRLAFSGRLV